MPQGSSRAGVWVAMAAIAMLSAAGSAVAEEHAADAEMAPVALSDYEHMQGSLRKLGRGVANVVTSPGELIRMPEQVGRQDGYLAGSTVGILQGAGRTLLRAGAGLLEIATFPFKNNPQGFAPIIQPEFVFAQGSWQTDP